MSFLQNPILQDLMPLVYHVFPRLPGRKFCISLTMSQSLSIPLSPAYVPKTGIAAPPTRSAPFESLGWSYYIVLINEMQVLSTAAPCFVLMFPLD